MILYIVVFVIIIVLLANLTIRAYRKSWSRRLDLSIEFGKDTLFEGEKGELLQIIVNRKLLPLWWGDLQFCVPNFLKFDDDVSINHEYYKKDAISVFSYEMVKKALPFTAVKRGYYTIKKVELLTSDMFFQYMFIKEYSIFTELYVFPQIKSIRKFNVDFRKIVGEIIAKRHVIEDPFEFRSIRDYYPFDSLKTVNWNASAKTGDIKVNHYNYTSSKEVIILLALDGYNIYDKQEIREDLIRIAAYFTRNMIKSGIPVGLVSNGCDSITGEEIFAPCKNGSSQEIRIFRLFARIMVDSISRPFTQVIDDKITNRHNSHYILISYFAGGDLQAKVHDLVAGGNSLQWLLVKDIARNIAVKKQKNMIICEAEY
jgi:uncharacterized protein (DUF58 family)